MNLDQQSLWRNEALDQVFAGLASSSTLSGRVIYKGARILYRRLETLQRQSLDIDMNLTAKFVKEFPDRNVQGDMIRDDISQSLTHYFREQNLVRYELSGVTVRFNPKDSHPRGWNAFAVGVQLRDLAHPGVNVFPVLQLDIAAPEKLGAHATAPLEVEGREVIAYTAQRIAGEKLRAFLSSLTGYREKMRRPGSTVRAKDLFDIARIVKSFPLSDPHHETFWLEVAEEFRLACESRFVDCDGISTFSQQLALTRTTYDRDLVLLRNEVSFDEAWIALESVVERLEALNVFPLHFDLQNQ